MRKDESKLSDDILSLLQRPDTKILTVNKTWGKPEKTGTTPGFPDHVVFCNGYIDLWELKTPELDLPTRKRRAGRLSKEQATVFAWGLKCGVEIQIIRTFEEAEARLRELRKLPPNPQWR